MPAAAADSALYARLFGDDETARLFTDSAEVRALLIVEGALARVQGDLGLIPAEAAAFIARAASEVQIDPASLAVETARNGVPIPALLAAFRKVAGAPEPMQWLHWGATSQDIMDTALALRLRPVLALWETRLTGLLSRLADLAAETADLPATARTYGQAATPTTFGAIVAAWGWPLIGWRDDLPALRDAVLQVSLSGAAGTLSAMGEHGPSVRAGLARALDLRNPGRSWHADRSGISHLAAFAAGLAGSLGKMGEDLLLLAQSGIDEVTLRSAGGASSTMPQKQNPVAPSALVALARHTIGLAALVQNAALHRQQRDGAAWFSEWLALPQLCICTGRMLSLGRQIADDIEPDARALARNLDAGAGLVHAEALTFALADRMPRPEAQDLVAALCAQATATGTPLAALAAARFPETDWPARLTAPSLARASAEAHAFATSAAPGET